MIKKTHQKGISNLPNNSAYNAFWLMNYGLTSTHFDKAICQCFKFCDSCFNEINESNEKSGTAFKYDYKQGKHLKLKKQI